MARINYKHIILWLVFLGADFWVWLNVISIPSIDKLIFLDVGQGDAQLIKLNKVNILVDTGPSREILQALSKNLSSFDRYLDLVILTHPELDHYGGLETILENYKIGAFLWNGREPIDNPRWQSLKVSLSKHGVPIFILKADDKIIYRDFNSLILAPNSALRESAKTNDSSIVQLIGMGRARILLTGDIGTSTEQYLLNRPSLKVDVLKVAHHGSSFSSGDSFLAALSPEISVIQVGALNRYGHPASSTLKRLGQQSRVYRTDQNGNILLEFASQTISVYPEH